jgi:ATP phosphoribosyltransferase regulatory subunit
MLKPRAGRSLVPIGMSTILPHTTRRVRGLEGRLLSHLAKRGYEEIILPSFEYLDVLTPGLESSVLDKCFHVADRATGRILLLRPDPTAQIARTVAMGLTGSSLPLRLCYRTSVFRHEPEHVGRDREIFQVGAELVGIGDEAGDAEIISLMATCLKEAGLRSFKISLGHVGFFQRLLGASGLSTEGRKQAEQAAAKKDIPRLEELLERENVPLSKRRGLLMVPGQYGGPEVLDQGYRLAGRNRALSVPLDRLSRVYRMLASAALQEHLLLDLGELRGFDYYDGIVFDVFAEGMGRELGGGGRYDHLIGRFGRDLPSTGFAFDIDRLFQVIKQDPSGPGLADRGQEGHGRKSMHGILQRKPTRG